MDLVVGLVLTGLHFDHTSKDDLLWPLLPFSGLLRPPTFTRMEAQHEGVDSLITQIEPRLKSSL